MAKRIIALALSFCIAALALPASALAEDFDFDITVSADADCVSVGDTVTVDITVDSITAVNGLSLVQFDFVYDPTQLLLTTPIKVDKSLDCVVSVPTEDVTLWENLSHTDYEGDSAVNSGVCSLSAITTNMESELYARGDGDIAFRLTFKVLDNSSAIELGISDSSICGAENIPEGYNMFVGRGSADTVYPHATSSTADCTSSADCDICGEVIVAAKGHTPGAEGTCVTAQTCTECGEPIGFGNHSFTSYTSDDNGTCIRYCTETAKCDYCDETDTRDIVGAYGDHSFTVYVSDGNATCMNNCTETAKCDNGCGTTDTREVEDSTVACKYTDYISNGDAKCESDGTKTALCDYGCGSSDTVTDVGSAKGHTDGEWVITLPAKDGNDGEKELHCADCDEVIDTGIVYFVILGDVSCTKDINSSDYVYLRRAVLGTYELSERAFLNGDINRDGAINAIDYVMLRRAVLGTLVLG